MLGGWVVDPGQSTGSGGKPDPSFLIHMQSRDESWRQAIGRCKAGKAPCRVTHQPFLVKAEPQIAGAVFDKRGCGSQWRKAIRLCESMKALSSTPPSNKTDNPLFGPANADPQVSARVFEHAVHP